MHFNILVKFALFILVEFIIDLIYTLMCFNYFNKMSDDEQLLDTTIRNRNQILNNASLKSVTHEEIFLKDESIYLNRKFASWFLFEYFLDKIFSFNSFIISIILLRWYLIALVVNRLFISVNFTNKLVVKNRKVKIFFILK